MLSVGSLLPTLVPRLGVRCLATSPSLRQGVEETRRKYRGRLDYLNRWGRRRQGDIRRSRLRREER